ncbi:hypothetical protein EVAR_60715_1 [Eumeta japonica]|uniref:Uncharacterized protein n=1 Tax=Eumeta variegata TaxID=151549 RepID=A0A4C1ZCT7_EUMVA|nr:hypothetical protein EVAR_60715_1 [Eumeta japonica]
MHWRGGVAIDREGMRERKERGRKRKGADSRRWLRKVYLFTVRRADVTWRRGGGACALKSGAIDSRIEFTSGIPMGKML